MGQWRKQVDASLIFLLALKGFLNFNIRILLGKTLVVSLHRNILNRSWIPSFQQRFFPSFIVESVGLATQFVDENNFPNPSQLLGLWACSLRQLDSETITSFAQHLWIKGQFMMAKLIFRVKMVLIYFFLAYTCEYLILENAIKNFQFAKV